MPLLDVSCSDASIGLKTVFNTNKQVGIPASTYCRHTDGMQGQQQMLFCLSSLMPICLQTGQQQGKLTLDEVVCVIDNVGTE